MRNRLYFALLIIMGFSACSLTSETDEGVVWEYNLDYDVVAGVVQEGNSVFFADEKGSIFNVWMDTGNVRWVRQVTNENIVLLYTAEIGGTGYLFVVSTNSGSSVSILRKYDSDYGELLVQTNISILPSANYSVYTNLTSHPILILHNNDNISTVDLYDNTFVAANYNKSSIDSSIDRIQRVVTSSDYFYIVDANSRVFKVDLNFFFQNASALGPGMNCYGSAAIYNNKLYVAGNLGMRIYNTSDLSADTDFMNDLEAKYSPFILDAVHQKIYVAFSSTGNPGIGKYDMAASLTEDWFYRSYDPFTYSAIYFAEILDVIAGLDDYGYINVVKADTGALVYINKYLGVVNRPYLKWARDYYGKTVYIPVNYPSKVYCYSLDYAVTQQN